MTNIACPHCNGLGTLSIDIEPKAVTSDGHTYIARRVEAVNAFGGTGYRVYFDLDGKRIYSPMPLSEWKRLTAPPKPFKWAIQTRLCNGDWVHADWTSDEQNREQPTYHSCQRYARVALRELTFDARALDDFNPRDWRVKRVPSAQIDVR